MTSTEASGPGAAASPGRRWWWAIAGMVTLQILVVLASDALDGPLGWLHDREAWWKTGLSLLAVAAVWLCPPRSRAEFPVFALLGTLGASLFFNLGAFHDRNYLHKWELFHYFLGAKYFPEVGYDGLYAASVVAERRITGKPGPLVIRDLRANEINSTARMQPQLDEVEARFSAARLASLERDLRPFLHVIGDPKVRIDHGYNPSPFWTFVARLFVGWLPASNRTLGLVASLDPLLLAILFAALYKTYGIRVGSLGLVLLGTGYPWRFFWTGGALLRYDWIAALGVGICLLKHRRHGTAGALFAYAALVRVFPIIFLFGPAIHAVRTLVRREDQRWLRRFAAGYAVMLVVGLAAGSLCGRGPAAWSDFAVKLKGHRAGWLTNNMGLEIPVVYGTKVFTDPTGGRPEPSSLWPALMARHERERLVWFGILLTVVLASLAVGAWRAPLDVAAVHGLGAAFAAFMMTCYYLIMLVLVPIRAPRWGTTALVGLSALMFAVHEHTDSMVRRFGIGSWVLAGLLVVWCVTELVLARRASRA